MNRIPVTGKRDYILGSDRRYIYNVSFREHRVSTDHRMLLSEIRG